MKRIIVLFSFLIVACNNENKRTSNQIADNFVLTDTSTSLKKNNTLTPLLRVFLPTEKRTLKEIDDIVSDIDKFIVKGKWKMERVYGINNEPCEIIRYYNDSALIQIRLSCGDCQNVMGYESYYFRGKSLICLKKYHIHYGFNPCWTEKDCKENGITEKFKKDNLRERNEKYYFLDSVNYSFKRTGNFNDTAYVTNDTLSQATILKDAIEYLNAME